MTADGSAVVETLRAELARAKEQAWRSDAAALKAVEELRAEQAAHCHSKDQRIPERTHHGDAGRSAVQQGEKERQSLFRDQ